jgi:Fic family protein
MAKKAFAANQINSLRERYYRALLGKESLINLINETEVGEHVYNSNAIENSTLSLEETEKILLQVDLDRYVNEREIHEAKNLARVMAYVETKAKAQELNLETILLLHKMLIGNIDDSIAGRFRAKGEYVRVGNYIAPAPEEIVPQLERMITEFQANAGDEIIKRVARFHLTFEHIHPFCDGNGRIGRVLNNYLLIREGYVPINIKFSDRGEYYQAFKDFDTKHKTELMSDIVAKALSISYHKRLAYLEGKKIITLSEFAKVKKTSLSGLLNKAKRQTIEAFLEKGVWKIGA